ncbi:MAG: cysteine hydrolase [Proteobacteria bacterium]|nr:cysteine hydrolase [Burkholderiales bacterium]
MPAEPSMASPEDLEAANRLTHREILASLDEKVRPAHTALLVIDMQNDFCADGGLVSKDGRDISEAQAMARRLPRLIDTARAAGVLAVFVRCEYSSEGNAFLSDVWLEQAVRERKGGFTRIPVCARESWEGDWYADIRPAQGDLIVVKHRYDAFQGTNLDLLLRSHGIRTLVLTGVVTNVCVETTARAGFVRDYYIAVVEDGCAAYLPEDHMQTLRNVRRFFGIVPTIDQLCALWAPTQRAMGGRDGKA